MSLSKERTLPQLIALLRESRDYYTFVQHESQDSEMAAVYAFEAQTRQHLLDDLDADRIMLRTPESVAAVMIDPAHSYARLRQQFDPRHPDLHAHALLEREGYLMRLIAYVFRSDASLGVRRAIKSHYPMFTRGAAMLQRVAARHEAA